MSAQGISRRSLIGGVGAAAAGVAAGVAAVPGQEITAWDAVTDVLVVGSGAAGLCAAIEARAAGAEVLLIESLPRFGGSSAMSGGVVYAGGGTALQRALGIEDSVEAMYDFIVAGSAPHPQLDKISLYCEDSVAHFDWLVEQGVPYSIKYTEAKGLPMGDESLYFSGNELAWPAREQARPAPRGHVPGVPGMNGGRRLVEALLPRAAESGATLRAGVEALRLVVESDGRVTGLIAAEGATSLRLHARRGIVLASGGFIHNREMLRLYAPELYACSVPWGNAGDLGTGIRMGMAVGAAALRMNQGFAIAPLYPPENVLSGIVVNRNGQRFIAEDSYHGVLGDAIAFHQQGKAWLIADAKSSYGLPQDNFPLVAQAGTVGELARLAGFPGGALQDTVAFYNRYAKNGRDPLFRKSEKYLRPLQGPPYQCLELSVDRAFFPAHTFGGLHTTIHGEVVGALGEVLPGLYAAGRTSAGIPTAPYFASGLSLGDCTYYGRRAGRRAAQAEVAA